MTLATPDSAASACETTINGKAGRTRSVVATPIKDTRSKWNATKGRVATVAAIVKPESTEGGRLVSILKWPEGAPLNLG